MPWWIRAYLGFAALQGLGIGLTGLLIPPEMQIPLRISPLNTRFVASLYVAGGVGVLGAAFARRKEETRLFVIGFGTATALILVLTIVHWPDFMADGLPHRPIWIFDYVVDPLLAVLVIYFGKLWPPAERKEHRLSRMLRIEALIFAVIGAALSVAPEAVAQMWPWALPPVLGQVYGAFFITFAVGAALAARETEPRAITLFVISTLTLAVLVLVISAIHLDRFKPEPITWVWFAAWAIAAATFTIALRTPRKHA